MSQLVIFDIDGTLIPGASSEVRFARYLLRTGHLGPRQLLAFLWFTLRYFPRYPRSLLQKNKAYLAGLDVSLVASLAVDFVTKTLQKKLYQPALLRLQAHQAAGDTVVLLSGTPEFIARALADTLGVETSVGAICAAENGRYSAKPPLSHPHGETKLLAAQELATKTGLSLSDAVAYGDSIHDVWLFRAVGKGIAVMPDRNLRATAMGEDWEIFG